MNSKRGLSSIVATVLIVLLALAAVAIVWSVISSMINKGGEEIDAASKCLEINLVPTACSVDKAADTVTVTTELERGDVTEMKVVVSAGDKVDSLPSTEVPATKFATKDTSAISLVNTKDITGDFKVKIAAVVEGHTCDPTASEITCTALGCNGEDDCELEEECNSGVCE